MRPLLILGLVVLIPVVALARSTSTLKIRGSGGGHAPSISNVKSVPSVTSAVITWTTSIGATSQVFYGLTSGYGSSTTKDNTLVLFHSQTLTSLSSSTLYHFKVESVANSHTVDSGDFVFTTGAAACGSTYDFSVACDSQYLGVSFFP